MAIPVPTTRASENQLAGLSVDLANILGAWQNTKSETDYFERILVTERDGLLLVRAFASSAPDPVDWGEMRARAYVTAGTPKAVGFHATYEFDRTRTEVAAITKLGILVVSVYTSFHDGSERLAHLAREFFHR